MSAAISILGWQAPAWAWWLGDAALAAIAVALLVHWRGYVLRGRAEERNLNRMDPRQHALEILVSLSTGYPPELGELTAAFTDDMVWELAQLELRDEADAIDRWLAAGCPDYATPNAIARLG